MGIRNRMILPQAARRMLKQQDGLAAMEFALVLPLMLLLGIASVEIGEGVAVDRQVALAAGTVANLTTQYASISASNDMPDILNASATVLTPYSGSNAVVIVSSITIDASSRATIAWSKALNGSPHPNGQSVNLPAALVVPNSSLIWGEVTYNYTPKFDFLHIGTLQMRQAIYMIPRLVQSIPLTP